jgi:hypothetical protein
MYLVQYRVQRLFLAHAVMNLTVRNRGGLSALQRLIVGTGRYQNEPCDSNGLFALFKSKSQSTSIVPYLDNHNLLQCIIDTLLCSYRHIIHAGISLDSICLWRSTVKTGTKTLRNYGM